MEDKKIKCEFTEAELFQIHLCIVCRSATATQKWTNAVSDEEQKTLQTEIEYLTSLVSKVDEIMKGYNK